MRRWLGAGVLVAALGASDVFYLVFHRGDVPADRQPPVIARAGGVVGGAAGASDPAAISSVPRSFRADPLGFLSLAPVDSLDLLPGIGPVLASRLVDARRARGSFNSWDDVLDVRGIGPQTIARLQALASRR